MPRDNNVHLLPENRRYTTALCGEENPRQFMRLDESQNAPQTFFNIDSKDGQPCAECAEKYEEQAAMREAETAAPQRDDRGNPNARLASSDRQADLEDENARLRAELEQLRSKG